ncbi:MAG: hypothetical protein V3V18_14520 [Methylococcales bacterium]
MIKQSIFWKDSTRVFCGVVLACITMGIISSPAYSASQLKAFSCAQGFGATATGGRGGDVYHVTKLSDYDSSIHSESGFKGTLRYGIESATGPRTIVFDVGGNIKLKNWLHIRNDQLTLAGQTAPGGGITISGYPVAVNNVSDIIIRHMRFRIGSFNVINPNGGNNNNKKLNGDGADSITVIGSDRIIMDHISASWSVDEVIDINTSENITLQNSIIANSLNDSLHPEGAHSKGILATGNTTKQKLENGEGGYTFYRNLIAHHDNRSPMLDGNPPAWMGAEFVNNVVYDWGKRSGHNNIPNVMMNYINNYLVAGPSLKPTDADNIKTAMRRASGSGDFFIYYTGTFMDVDRDSDHDGQLIGDLAFKAFKDNERLSERLPFPTTNNIDSAEAAYQKVLKNAGASLNRDSSDRKVIDDVKSRSGGLINTQTVDGGLVTLSVGTKPVDSDKDGMTDSWEQQNGLDPNDATDRNGTDLSSVGYTNLEVYLDSITASAGDCALDSPEAIDPPVVDEEEPTTVDEPVVDEEEPTTVDEPVVDEEEPTTVDEPEVIDTVVDEEESTTVDEPEVVDPPVENEPIPVSSSTQTEDGTTLIQAPIANSHDDAEEKENGLVVVRSIDIDLMRSGSNQAVGLRFEGLDIPNSATIVNASIQFSTSHDRSETTSLTIEGENTDNAEAFTHSIQKNITARPRTDAAVFWDPAPWDAIGDAGVDQQSPDLSAIFQEIIDRPGWSGNNAMALIITGNGKRNAYSYEGNQSKVPVLHIEYQNDGIVETSSLDEDNTVIEVDAPIEDAAVIEDNTSTENVLFD